MIKSAMMANIIMIITFYTWQVFVDENDVHYLRTTECILDCTVIGQASRVRSFSWCTFICNKHLTYEVFGYASSTKLCQLAGALFAPSDSHFECAIDDATVFKSGKIVSEQSQTNLICRPFVCFPKIIAIFKSAL